MIDTRLRYQVNRKKILKFMTHERDFSAQDIADKTSIEEYLAADIMYDLADEGVIRLEEEGDELDEEDLCLHCGVPLEENSHGIRECPDCAWMPSY